MTSRKLFECFSIIKIKSTNYQLPTTSYSLLFQPSPKMLQNPHIILIEISYIIDAIEQHREALQAHAEGVAAPDFRVVADGFEHGGIHHATTPDLDPRLLHLGQMRRGEIHFE